MPLDIFYANDLIDVLHVGSTEDIEIARIEERAQYCGPRDTRRNRQSTDPRWV